MGVVLKKANSRRMPPGSVEADVPSAHHLNFVALADYVAIDGTNIDSYDPTADALQLRPLQVLFEVWAA